MMFAIPKIVSRQLLPVFDHATQPTKWPPAGDRQIRPLNAMNRPLQHAVLRVSFDSRRKTQRD